MVGAPYQLPQVWIGNTESLINLANVCTHPGPHVPLRGNSSRRTMPYPRELAWKFVQGIVAELQNHTRIGIDLSNLLPEINFDDAPKRLLKKRSPASAPFGSAHEVLLANDLRKIQELRYGKAIPLKNL